MKKIFTIALLALIMAVAHGSYATIIGPPGGCVGTTTTLVDSSGTSGGVWSSSNPAVATVGASTGVVTAVATGTTTISYVVGATTETYMFSVSIAPASITGSTSLCPGTSVTFSDATTGGTWNSSNPSVATIVSTTGVATGVAMGTTFIQYQTGPGCMAVVTATVSGVALPDSVTGPGSVCTGSTITLADATTGGTWSSTSTGVATVSSTGVVTGIAPGVTSIHYTVAGTCGATAYSSKTIVVTSTTAPGTITGTATVATGATTTLYDGTTGGTWSSSNTSIATISATGVVTGIAPGTCTISYAVSGCSGVAYATTVIAVTAFDGISGHVLFTGSGYSGPVRVWLIVYDSSTFMLTATDSTSIYCSGSSIFYQFTAPATGVYRVKAATIDSFSASSGYMPTYHNSSLYWNTATLINHTAGTADINEDITMITGTTPSGPGFIAGDVTMGANKGTAGGIPSVGLLMYIEDNATGSVIQKTYTDAAGHYSFGSLPVGTYRVYPELINYVTTPYSSITLTSGTTSMMAASFEQHTVSYTITPFAEAVGNVTSTASYISTFPNPTSGKLNINWSAAATEQGNVTVSDITGRNVYTSTINMSKGAGATQLDLSGLINGLYMISIKSASMNYNNKIQVQK